MNTRAVGWFLILRPTSLSFCGNHEGTRTNFRRQFANVADQFPVFPNHSIRGHDSTWRVRNAKELMLKRCTKPNTLRFDLLKSLVIQFHISATRCAPRNLLVASW
ncbi:hypothetical protein F5141DRAFT_1151654 [Pisolithus sp. B1]|nr:hypothetical protein F5141DRAFT_1151654 [Pisolithus sp. B1]